MTRMRTALHALVWQKGLALSPEMREFLERRLEHIYDLLQKHGVVANDGRRYVFALVLIEEPTAEAQAAAAPSPPQDIEIPPSAGEEE
ncbi:MAG TPA: hypothetical protein VM492_13495 [Sumerlaeia bacterium]|nr:hypothetical protein [Sumerlaeia bacterium]